MGNLFSFCKPKNLQPYIKENDLLNNTIHCNYCNKTMLFNEYYKHLNICKRNSIDYHPKYGDI